MTAAGSVGDGSGIVLDRPAAGVAVLTLDRPRSRNALRRDDWITLTDVLTALDRDESIDVVVLTGRDVFCAGVDMGSGRGDPAGPRGTGDRVADPPPAAEFSRLTRTLVEVHAAVDRLRTMVKPTVCAVERYAIGPGLSLAVACDTVFAATDAFFASPRVDLGMLPDTAVAWALVRTLGYHRAYALVCLGRRLNACDAAQRGLVHETTTPGAALGRAVDFATGLASLPRDTLRLAKQLLRAAEVSTFEAAVAAESAVVALNKLSPAATAAREAYFNRPTR